MLLTKCCLFEDVQINSNSLLRSRNSQNYYTHHETTRLHGNMNQITTRYDILRISLWANRQHRAYYGLRYPLLHLIAVVTKGSKKTKRLSGVTKKFKAQVWELYVLIQQFCSETEED